MKRTFADLNLRLNVKDHTATLQMISKVATLGYRLIAVPLRPETPANKIAELHAMSNEAKIDFASRIDLQPRTQNELIYQLRRFRRKYEVVSVACQNKAVARQAAKDRRVDLLNFPSLDFHRRFFDKAEAELASNSLTALEINLKPLLVLEGPIRIRLLSILHRETAIANQFNVPIALSSGASEEKLLRKPREMAALAFLFSLDEASALEAISQNPKAIIDRNREKLDSRFVAPGIRVVKEEKNC